MALSAVSPSPSAQPLGEVIPLRGAYNDSDAAHGTLRVLIADHHRLVRAGLRALLQAERGITVVGEAATGPEAVRRSRETHPDVILMDADLPGLGFDGLEATRRIAADPDLASISVLVLAASETQDQARVALSAGARHLLLKDTDPRALVHAVRAHGTTSSTTPRTLSRTPACDPSNVVELARARTRTRVVASLILFPEPPKES